MKLKKEELKQKINDLVADNETAIELLEDIEDSFIEGTVDDTTIEELNSKLVEMQQKFEDLQKKYRDRFVSGVIKENKEDVEDEEDEELEVVDIKEI